MNIHSDNTAAGKGDNVIVLARPDGKPISLVSGDTVTAEVIDVIGSDLVALRISSPTGKGEDAQGTVMVARTNVPLSEGDQIALQVQGGDNEVSLKYLGKITVPEPPPSQASTAAAQSISFHAPAPPAADIIQQKIQLLLSELVDARLTSSDFQDLQKVLNNIPASVKTQYPEFNMLSSLVPDIEKLNSQTLQASVESSGVMLETNIKQSALQALNNAPNVVLAKQVLNSIVQKAVDAFQYPQSEGHTRSFLSDLIAVTYKGIQALNSNNASDTLNLLKQAIEDCLTIVEQDKTQHQSCNCDDVLTSVRQKLDEAIAALSSPKDTATAAASSPKDDVFATPEQGRPQRVVVEGGEVLTAVKQKFEEAAAAAGSPKVDVFATPEQGRPQRVVVEGGEVLTAVKQKFEEAAAAAGSPKVDVFGMPEQGRPERVVVEGGEVLTAVKQKIEEAAAAAGSPKVDVIGMPEQGRPQHVVVEGGEVLTAVKQKIEEAAAAAGSPKVDVIGMPEQGRPQRVVVEGGEVLTAVKQKIEEAAAAAGSPKVDVIGMPEQGRPQRVVVEGGGVLTVVRQKFDEAVAAVSSPKDNASSAITSSQKDEHIKAALNVDQKALLLKIKDILQDDKMAEALKYSPSKRDDLVGVVDKFIKNIEYFQLTSRANDMVYTYLPFLWNELRDGELLFKKNKYHAKKSFTCDINLDLDRLGKLSISVTAADGGFYISFNAEKDKTKQLIMEYKGELEKRFVMSGLSLKIINIGQKGKLDFASGKKNPSGGLDLRI